MPQQMINDEVLGRLVWDRRYEWWSGETQFAPGHEVHISIETEVDDEEEVLQRARRAFQRLRTLRDQVCRAAASELLAEYNADWNDGEPIGAEAFIDRMTLSDITFYADGSAELFFDAGAMFEGRSIVVSVDADGAIEEAAISG